MEATQPKVQTVSINKSDFPELRETLSKKIDEARALAESINKEIDVLKNNLTIAQEEDKKQAQAQAVKTATENNFRSVHFSGETDTTWNFVLVDYKEPEVSTVPVETPVIDTPVEANPPQEA